MTGEGWLAWLGPAADELTDEQRERFLAEAEEATARIGDDPDLAAEREAAWSAIVAYLLGDLTIEQAGRERLRTVEAERHASLAAQQIARLAVQDGMPEAEAARRSGLTRMTVRRALGK